MSGHQMRDDEAREFFALLGGVAELLRQDGKLTGESLALYWAIFQDQCNMDTFRQILTMHLKDTTPVGQNGIRGNFFPKPSDLQANLEQLRGVSHNPLAAWQQVLDSVATYGRNLSVTFADTNITKAIVRMGGWITLCSTLEPDNYAQRMAFVECYQAALKDLTPAPSYLLGATSAHDMQLARRENKTIRVNPIRIGPPGAGNTLPVDVRVSNKSAAVPALEKAAQ